MSLGGQQQVVFNLPAGAGPTPAGTADVDITFLPFQVSANNSDTTLFLSDNDGLGVVGTTIDLTVAVSALDPEGTTPTGRVIFTATPPSGSKVEIGSAVVDASGRATIQVDSILLAVVGTVVEASYTGDASFKPRVVGDGRRASTDLNNDVVVNDNPVIPPNAQNLTVIVVCGDTTAEQLRWVNTAREYYGTGAYIITNMHSVGDLARELGRLPKGSITRLVLGAHGNPDGSWFDRGRTMFNAEELNRDPPSRDTIRAAFGSNARIEYQSCQAADGPDGINNMQGVADALRVTVWGANRCISVWDDGWTDSQNLGPWRKVTPKP